MVRYSRLVGGRDRDEVGQRLIESALSGDLGGVRECLESDAGVDVNYIGTVSLRVKCIESVVAEEEEADELEIGYRDFVTDVTPLFAAAHSGHLDIARKLLSAGSDVNQELFRGFATTAAARQGHCEILDMLLKAAASKSACEHALLEACLCDQANATQLLICSEMTGPDAPVAQHALVLATCRGYLEVASTLIQNGVDKNCVNRVLLRSAKPALHANVDCTPLVAAIVSRQMNMVKYLLEVGAKTDTLIRLGAWSWDVFSGEELRVGACLGEPYNEAWCAVEYYEASGEILRLLLEHQACFLKSQVQGRTLLCHAILCQNPDAVSVLLESGADIEFPIRTEKGNESRPIHLSARVGCLPILKRLILHRCDIDSMTESGDTALMVAAKFDQPECFLELVTAGADLGLVNDNGESAVQLAKRSVFGSSLSDILSQAIMIKESNIKSSDLEVFSVLHFAAAVGNVQIMEVILKSLIPTDMIINKHDGSGLTPILVAAKSAHTDVFRILIESGAHVSLKSRDGQTLSFILKQHSSSSVQTRFEEILLDSLLSQTVASPTDFRALHFAARVGNSEAVTQLLKLGFPINGLDDENGYSPLMVAAKEGNAECCKVLLQNGADFTMLNDRGETALSVAKKNSKCKSAEEAIFDHMARDHVVTGEEIWKHTREGRGPPHLKVVKMLKSGVLTWGKAARRNVVCKEAVAGSSLSFSKNIRKKKNFSNGDNEVFRVVTETGREVHFEVTSYEKMLLWVRGIGLVSKEANNFGDWLPNSLVESKI